MQIISKYFSDGKEVDLEKTILASILASSEPFTIDELTDGIRAANRADDTLEDRIFIRGKVRGLVAGVLSNPLCPLASYYICDEMPDGRYQRREAQKTQN